ncbi:DUF6941 family protein [Streptosporangium sp. NBC_01469]|uniref:DUF6941 family protein n=1 Tax=Streptosporangium sp. NBC_01469 TaxID=2903898 RepID=UPI003FCD0249
MEAFILLADAATTDSGSSKINLLGAGWSLTGPEVPPSAVSVFLRIPWSEAKNEISFRLRLLDVAGGEVRVALNGDRNLSIGGSFGLPEDTAVDDDGRKVPLNIAFCVPLPPLPLEPGQIYRWAFEAAGTEIASASFAVRPKA